MLVMSAGERGRVTSKYARSKDASVQGPCEWVTVAPLKLAIEAVSAITACHDSRSLAAPFRSRNTASATLSKTMRSAATALFRLDLATAATN